MNTFLLGLGVLAGLLQLTGYGLYYFKLFKRGIKPNIASWLLWAGGGVVGFLSYRAMTHDWAKSILPMLCNASCILIFLYALKTKHYKPMIFWEKCAAGVYAIAAIVAFATPSYGNIIQQSGTFVSFIPTYAWVWKNPKAERPLPWVVWSCAYATLLAICILKFVRWQELVYPINSLCLHLGVGVLAALRTLSLKTLVGNALQNRVARSIGFTTATSRIHRVSSSQFNLNPNRSLLWTTSLSRPCWQGCSSVSGRSA